MDFIVDFICRFYGFHKKSTWFHMKDQEKVKNITWMSCSYWFHVKSARFQSEICWISCKSKKKSVMNSFLYQEMKSTVKSLTKSCLFQQNAVEINNILWNAMDFMKSFEIYGFQQILLVLVKLCWILWNCAKFCWFYEILWNSVAFSKILLDFMKYWWISWNPPNFRCNSPDFRFHLTQPPPCTLWNWRAFLELSDLKGFMH